MECYTYLRNVTDLLSDGKTPYERRFGQPFKGPIIPFGSVGISPHNLLFFLLVLSVSGVSCSQSVLPVPARSVE